MIVEKSLENGYYIIREHVNHVHTLRFQLIGLGHCGNGNSALYCTKDTLEECEQEYNDRMKSLLGH